MAFAPFRWVSSAVRTVDKGVSSVVSPVAKRVEYAARYASRTVGVPLQVAQKALNVVTNNPVWSVAQTGVSFIPGIGQAVSSGMAVASAVGRGVAAHDLALTAAKNALPGGPIAATAFDVAVGLIKGGNVNAASLAAARNQIPGGALGRAGFDLAVSLLLGKSVSVKNVVVEQARSQLAKSPGLAAAFDAGAGLASGRGVPASVVERVRAQVPGGALGHAAFDTAVVAARSHQMTPELWRSFQTKLARVPNGGALATIARTAVRAYHPLARDLLQKLG